jgi:hypothetical protein
VHKFSRFVVAKIPKLEVRISRDRRTSTQIYNDLYHEMKAMKVHFGVHKAPDLCDRYVVSHSHITCNYMCVYLVRFI